MSQFARSRSATVGPSTRPVAIPDDLDEPGIMKAHGVVELPPRVHWSGTPRSFDLADPHDRALVYELVLSEGTEDDIRHFIGLHELIDIWPRLVLPSHVRQAWTTWLAQRHGISLTC